MTLQRGIVFFLLNPLSLNLFIAGGHVTGRRLALCAGFSALKNYDVSGHELRVLKLLSESKGEEKEAI